MASESQRKGATLFASEVGWWLENGRGLVSDCVVGLRSDIQLQNSFAQITLYPHIHAHTLLWQFSGQTLVSGLHFDFFKENFWGLEQVFFTYFFCTGNTVKTLKRIWYCHPLSSVGQPANSDSCGKWPVEWCVSCVYESVCCESIQHVRVCEYDHNVLLVVCGMSAQRSGAGVGTEVVVDTDHVRNQSEQSVCVCFIS